MSVLTDTFDGFFIYLLVTVEYSEHNTNIRVDGCERGIEINSIVNFFGKAFVLPHFQWLMSHTEYLKIIRIYPSNGEADRISIAEFG